MEIKLSILIATMPSRVEKLHKLFDVLAPQKVPELQVLVNAKHPYNLGRKRNELLQESVGEYVTYIDDDDRISADYVQKILEACKTGADCIGISGVITTNGRDERQWHISKEYKTWHEQLKIYYRTPNHISPVRRELALQTGFPEKNFAEDYDYSMRLLPLLKTEALVKGNIYYYDYITNKK